MDGKLIKLNPGTKIPYENKKSILVSVEKEGKTITAFLPKSMYNFKTDTHFIPASRTVTSCRVTKGSEVQDVEVSIEKFIETFATIYDVVPESKPGTITASAAQTALF